MIKQPYVCFLFLIILFSNYSWAQEQWDLKRAVEYAVKNNISVKQADLQARFSQLQLSQNKLSQYPNANFQSNIGYRFGRSENPTTGVLEDNNFLNSGFNLSTNATLFNWFSIKHGIEAARLSYEADRAQVNKVQDDIALNVAVAYLQVLLAREQSKVAAIQVSQTATQLEATRKQVAAGNLPELNAAELEAQLARDSSQLITMETSAQQLLLQLKAVLNMDASLPFDIASPPIEQIPVESLADLQPEAVYSLALANLAGQRVNQLRWQSSQASIKSARGSMMPTFSVYGSLGSNYVNIRTPQDLAFIPNKATGAVVNINGTNYSVLAPGFEVTSFGVTPVWQQFRNNFGQNVGIALNVPIFNAGNLRTNWERSKLTAYQWELQIQQDNQQLKQDIYKAYTDAVAALQKYNAFRKSVATAEKAYSFAQKRYELNLLSTYELINSQNNLLRSRTELLSAQFDYVFKMKLLEFYKGQGLRL